MLDKIIEFLKELINQLRNPFDNNPKPLPHPDHYIGDPPPTEVLEEIEGYIHLEIYNDLELTKEDDKSPLYFPQLFQKLNGEYEFSSEWNNKEIWVIEGNPITFNIIAFSGATKHKLEASSRIKTSLPIFLDSKMKGKRVDIKNITGKKVTHFRI